MLKKFTCLYDFSVSPAPVTLGLIRFLNYLEIDFCRAWAVLGLTIDIYLYSFAWLKSSFSVSGNRGMDEGK